MIATQRATHKSPAVRLHISLTGELDQPQENIMKVTQGEARGNPLLSSEIWARFSLGGGNCLPRPTSLFQAVTSGFGLV